MQRNVAADIGLVQNAFMPFAAAAADRLEKSPNFTAEWHGVRIDKLRKPLQDRLAMCGKDSSVIACGCRSIQLPHGCALHWVCAPCMANRARIDKAKIARAISRTMRKQTNLSAYTLTLTASHSGDIAADCEWWRAAVSAFTASMRRKWRKGMVHILTRIEGTDGIESPHIHTHCVILCPFLPYAKVWRTWRKICRHSRKGLPPRDCQHLRIDRVKREGAAKQAAHYLIAEHTAGYLVESQGEAEHNPLTDTNLGTFAGAMYGKRTLRKSNGLSAKQQNHCKLCKCLWQHFSEREWAECAPTFTPRLSAAAMQPPDETGQVDSC